MNKAVPNASQEIQADKINISTLFSKFWFRVPEYQRSYVWGKEQIDELLDDLNYAITVNPNKEYFLGSVVLQKHTIQSNNVSFECCDVLDGQQRMTTLFLLMAVLRDISANTNLKKKAKASIFQNEDIFSNQPERIRIEFLIRDEVADFVNNFVKTDGGTDTIQELKELQSSKNVSLKNMASSMLYLRERFEKLTPDALNQLAVFLFQKVIVI